MFTWYNVLIVTLVAVREAERVEIEVIYTRATMNLVAAHVVTRVEMC